MIEEEILDFARKSRLLREDFFPSLIMEVSPPREPAEHHQLVMEFRNALLRASATNESEKNRASKSLFAYIVSDIYAYKTIDFKGFLEFSNQNSITDDEFRFIIDQVNVNFAHPAELELTSHGLKRSFRFWSEAEKLQYLDFANNVILHLTERFGDTCFGYGLVLSLTRQMDLTPHDDDIDILVAVPSDDYPVFSQAILDVENYLVSGGYTVFGDWKTHRKVVSGGMEIDVFVGLQEDDTVAFFPGPRDDLLYSDVFPPQQITFIGKTIAVPQRSEVYLEKIYGADWRSAKVGWQHRDNWILFEERFSNPVETAARVPSGSEEEHNLQSKDIKLIPEFLQKSENNVLLPAQSVTGPETALSLTIARWSEGVAHEVAFWRTWLRERGGDWRWDFNTRLDPDFPVQGMVDKLLRDVKGPVKILDVGAGPLSVVGKVHGERRIELRACDPLADLYNILLVESDVKPTVTTEFATAEDLSVFFEESYFDVVYCQNALDHSFEPVRAIIEMLRVLKVGGRIALHHYENEAEKENYSGFHQFNFKKQGEDFVIWNKSGEINLRHCLPVSAAISVENVGEHVQVVITKLSEFSDISETSRHRERTSKLLRELVTNQSKNFVLDCVNL